MDELIAKSNSTMDTEEQKAAFKEIQQYVAENALALPLYHQVCFIYTSDDLDTAGSEFGNDQFSMRRTFLTGILQGMTRPSIPMADPRSSSGIPW